MFAFSTDYNIKNFNKRVSLDLIRFTPGGISRAELARKLGLTRSAVTSIINEFLSTQLVREAENGPATGGRRPILLELNPARGYLVGVDLGATHLTVLVTDFSVGVISEIEVPFDITRRPEVCLEQIDHNVSAALDKAGIKLEQVLAVGVGVPGPVVAEAGAVISPPIMPGWNNYPIRSDLEQRWRRLVSLNNDAELGALGEWSHGAGRGERNLAYIKVGTGVGAGLLLDGKIYRGVSGSAGEIGHITIDENGPQCSCGNYGCLEAVAGGHAIAQHAIEAVQKGRRTLLSSIEPIEAVTALDVANAARRGDLIAQQIVSEAGAHIGIAIASLVNLFNPGMVIVGGGVAQVGDLLLQPIRQSVMERSLPSTARAVRITAAILGRRSSAIGAVVQATDLALSVLTESDTINLKGGQGEEIANSAYLLTHPNSLPDVDSGIQETKYL